MSSVVDGDLRDLYQDLILDHGKRPHNFRIPSKASHEALGHNPLCGDRLHLYLDLDGAGKISDAAFQGSGCAISTASASMMTDMVKGLSEAEAEKLFTYLHEACTGGTASTEGLKEDDIDRLKALAGVKHYPMRVKCATLPWHTLQAALHNTKKVSTE